MRRWRRWLLVVALLLPLPALSTVLLDWGVDELARRADLVIIGTVESHETVAVDRTLMTDTKIRVSRTLAGKPLAIVTVRQLGGQLGDRIVDVPGDAVLEIGHRYLLFTAQPRGDTHRYLVGMSLGAIAIQADGALTQTITVPLITRTGALREETAPRQLDLAAIERAIREAKR